VQHSRSYTGLNGMVSGTVDRGALKREFLELLRSDWEFRRAVAAELGLLEILGRMDKLEERMARIEEQMVKLWEKVEEHTKAIKALQEQVARLQEQVARLQEQVAEHTRAIRALQEELRRFGDRLAALGARWGLYAEETFRDSLRKFIQEYFGVARVDKWEFFDREGIVFGYPALVEIDVVVKDDTHYLIEIKSSTSAADVRVFNEKCKLYQKVVKPPKARKVIVTCYADDKAREAARALDVEIIAR
jgi:hypothetical protein